MSRSIFQQKKKRLRTRRILIVAVAVLLAVSLIVGLILLLGNRGSSKKETPKEPVTEKTPTVESQPVLTPLLEPVRALPTEYLTANTKTPHIALYDLSAQTMLFSKAGDEECSPASLTKLMTAIVALEYLDPDTLLTAGNELNLIPSGAKRAGIYSGYRLTLKQALQGLLMESGSDAAYVIAAHVGHIIDPNATVQASVDIFCQKMTQMAKDNLGCTATTFLNPDGMDKDKHKSTANDLLKIAMAALNEPVIAEIVATQEVTVTFASGQEKTWKNGNKLLQSYEGACGLKTGDTADAGKCIAACATRDGRTVICIMLGAGTGDLLLSETTQLLDLSFP